MTRTIRRTIAFRRPFYLTGVDRLLPPGDYDVVTDEELIEGLSFSAYHRVSTAIFVPAPSGSAIEMVTIDPLDLEAALERDAASPPPANAQPQRDRDLIGFMRSTERIMKSLVTLLALILVAGFSAATPKSQVACDKAGMNWDATATAPSAKCSSAFA